MISKNPNEPQASPLPGTQAEASTPLPNPWDKIEVASTGGGTVNDPGAKDTKPPSVGDFDLNLIV